MTSATGTCTVRYDQPGNASFNPAPQVTESVTAVKINQTITFAALGNKTFGDADFKRLRDCVVGAGCELRGLRELHGQWDDRPYHRGRFVHDHGKPGGNGNFNAAADVPRTFTIGKATSTTAVTCPTSVDLSRGRRRRRHGGGDGRAG